MKRRGASEWCILGTCRIVKLVPAEQLQCLLEQPRRPHCNAEAIHPHALAVASLSMIVTTVSCKCTAVRRARFGGLELASSVVAEEAVATGATPAEPIVTGEAEATGATPAAPADATEVSAKLGSSGLRSKDHTTSCFMLASSSNALTAMIADP